MYHVAGTVIAVSLIYFISLFFSRIGFYSLAFHRKLWNIILASVFLATALSGLFMALQVNFKWDIPVIKEIQHWHVEIGVGLAITGIFHFLWHLSYFRKRTDAGTYSAEVKKETSGSSSIITNLFVVGFTSTSVQFLMLREIMNIAGGFELMTGIFLGSWLIGSASGAAIAGKSGFINRGKINLVFSISPFISLFLLILLTKFFLETGETPSFMGSMILTLVVLFPFCMVSGFAFIKLIRSASAANGITPGKSFSIETTGGIISGLLLSILTSGNLNTYELLIIIGLLTLAWTLLTDFIEKVSINLLTRLLFTIIISAIIVFDTDVLFRQLLLPGIKVTDTHDTPYGNITIGDYAGEESKFYNHRLIAYNDDVIEREEDIHYALLQLNNPEKVLMIAGSLNSHLPEILKYPVKEITYIERDPALAESARSVRYSGNAVLKIENKDAYRYIKTSGEKMDAIILLLPPPSTFSLNRYYSMEFLKQIKARLSEEGVFMCSPGPADNYLNQESIKLYSSVLNTLCGIFNHVTPVSGNKLYLIASDHELSVSFCSMAEEKKIRNTYVSSDFLSDDLIENKSEEIRAVLDPLVRQNRLAFPVASLHSQSYSLSRNMDEKIPAVILMIIAFAGPLFLVRRRNMIMYFSASALAGFEIIMLLLLQLTAGNMYQFTGIILATTMAGLAAGAGINFKVLDSVKLRIKSMVLVIYYLLLALCVNPLLEIKSLILSFAIIILLIFPASFLTGNIFSKLNEDHPDGSVSSSVYSADLAGSALGFILISGIAIPALGIRASVFLLAGLIFTGILFGTESNK
jgi:spermidine synthase